MQIDIALVFLADILVISLMISSIIWLICKILGLARVISGVNVSLWAMLCAAILGLSIGFFAGNSREGAVDVIISILLSVMVPVFLFFYSREQEESARSVENSTSNSGIEPDEISSPKSMPKEQEISSNARNSFSLKIEALVDQVKSLLLHPVMRFAGIFETSRGLSNTRYTIVFLCVFVVSVLVGTMSGSLNRSKFELQHTIVDVCVAQLSNPELVSNEALRREAFNVFGKYCDDAYVPLPNLLVPQMTVVEPTVEIQ